MHQGKNLPHSWTLDQDPMKLVLWQNPIHFGATPIVKVESLVLSREENQYKEDTEIKGTVVTRFILSIFLIFISHF